MRASAASTLNAPAPTRRTAATRSSLDSITTLEAEKAGAYEVGDREAYAGYQELSARTVAELLRRRITVGRSIELIEAARVGVLLEEAIHEWPRP